MKAAVILLALFLGTAVAMDLDSNEAMDQLKKVSLLMCNLEVKKFILENTDRIKVYRDRDDWHAILRKLIAVAMTKCIHELSDLSKVETILKNAEKTDMSKSQLPFGKTIDIDRLAEGDKTLSYEEEETYHKYESSDSEVKKANEEMELRKSKGKYKTEPSDL